MDGGYMLAKKYASMEHTVEKVSKMKRKMNNETPFC
jgi:hypothetical protein